VLFARTLSETRGSREEEDWDQDGFFHQRVFAIIVGDSIARCRARKPLNKDSVGVGAELYYKGADMCYFARRTRRLR
jgi:hypothetical protein